MKLDPDQLDDAWQLGVVLTWIERQQFGRCGYLVSHQREPQRDRPVCFTQASLIDPNEPVLEGSVVNYRLDHDNRDFDRLIPVNIEVERFTTHNHQLDFKKSDLWDFPRFEPDDPLGNHLLDGFSHEQKQSLEQYRKEVSPVMPQELIDYLNAIITGPPLFQKERFTKVKFRRLTKLLLERTPQHHEVTWLNRLLLEDAYPESFMQKPLGLDCSKEIFEGTVDSCDFGRRHGSLKLLNGESCIFSFDTFPVDELVPQTMDRVQCRIVDDYIAYDIWPLPQSKQAEEMKIVIDRLQSVTKAAVERLKTANVETRAVTEAFKETTQPLREMYKDQKMANVRADSIRENVPDWIVDIIVSHYFKEGFPSKGDLHRYLAQSGGLNKLRNSGRGDSIQTIARLLSVARKHMERQGFIEKRRGFRGTQPQSKEHYNEDFDEHQKSIRDVGSSADSEERANEDQGKEDSDEEDS